MEKFFFCLLVACLVVLAWALGVFKKVSPKLAPNEPVEMVNWCRQGRDYLLAIRWSDGNIYHYRGECTVWHCYPSGKRCHISMESWLCDRWTTIRWREQDGGLLVVVQPEVQEAPKLPGSKLG